MGFYLNNHFEGKKLAIRIQMIEKQKYFTNLTGTVVHPASNSLFRCSVLYLKYKFI